MSWPTIFNPFSKLNEKIILSIGILFFVINIIICYFGNIVNDAVFHYSSLRNPEWGNIIKTNFLSSAILILVLFTLGKIINKRTRIIDIVNSVLFSQIPLILIIPINKLPFIENTLNAVSKIEPNKTQTLPITDLLLLTVYGFAIMLLLIYSFTLLYNGFKTATNIKKWQHIVIFCFITFLTIAASQIIL